MADEEMSSAEKWGRTQAARAPLWSEKQWRRACAILDVSPPAAKSGQDDPRTDPCDR